MDTLITRYPVAFTDAADLPVIVPALPSVGVNTYDNRWTLSRSTALHGAALATVSNEVDGGLSLAQASVALRPLIQRAGDEAWMKFDGADDWIGLTGFARAQPFTVSMVARVRSEVSKTAIRLTSSGTSVQVVTTGGATPITDMRATSTVKIDGADSTDGAWHVITASYNGASSVIAFDASTNTGTTGAGDATVLTFGNSSVGVGNTDYDIAEIITWPHALTAPQTQTVRNALVAAHPTLF